MDKKKKIILISCALLVVLLIGVTYAWLTLTRQGEKVNIIKSGTLELIYENESEGILLEGEKAQPILEDEGLESEGYNFTLRNAGDIGLNYTIYLDDVAEVDGKAITSRMADKFVRYALNYTENNTTKLLSSTGTNPNRVLYTGSLTQGASKDFNLKLWIDSTADNSIIGTTFAGKIRVEAEQTNAPVVSYYAHGTPTTESTTDYTTLEYNVFSMLGDDGSKGVCINDGGLFCIKANDYDNTVSILKEYYGEDNCQQLSQFSNSFNCTGDTFNCGAGTDGYVDCYDKVANKYCRANADGTFHCY